jgi:hypothetical protein
MRALAGVADQGLQQRNRRTLGVLLAIMAALVLAAFAIGIRW